MPGRWSDWAQIAEKTHRTVARAGGGIEERELLETERNAAGAFGRRDSCALVRLSRRVESLIGRPQDIEWAISQEGDILVLQSRDIRLPLRSRQAAEAARGEVLLRGGVCASPGRCVGRVKMVHSTRDFEAWRNSPREPSIMVLPQSMPDAAGLLPDFRAWWSISATRRITWPCVAREYSRPMLTGAGKATQCCGTASG